MNIIPFLAQIEAEKTLTDKGVLNLMMQADPIVKFTMLVLIFFSVMSWAIIFYKYFQVKRSQKLAENFWARFVKTKSLSEAKNDTGPLFNIYELAMHFFPRFREAPERLRNKIIEQKLTQAREEEIYKLEQYTSFLATTAATAPFVGLFGTVWGILTAFWKIGSAGSSSLATVGPYISEALIATAAGLAAAIPAVVAYNYFVRKIKVMVKMIDLFLDDLLIRIYGEL